MKSKVSSFFLKLHIIYSPRSSKQLKILLSKFTFVINAHYDIKVTFFSRMVNLRSVVGRKSTFINWAVLGRLGLGPVTRGCQPPKFASQNLVTLYLSTHSE